MDGQKRILDAKNESIYEL